MRLITSAAVVTIACCAMVRPDTLAQRPTAAGPAPAPSYRVVPVTVPQSEIPPGGNVRARGLDDSGNVVVVVIDRIGARQRTYLWNQGRRTAIEPPPTYRAWSVDVAGGSGTLAGTCWRTSGLSDDTRAFVMERGRVRMLAPPPGTFARPAHANGPYVTGRCTQVKDWRKAARPGRAVLWTNGRPRIIGPLDVSSGAGAVNRRGEIIVTVQAGRSGDRSAYIWHDGRMTPLLGLEGSQPYSAHINDSGQVAGTCTMARPTATSPPGTYVRSLPVMWVHGSPRALTVPQGSGGEADAINNHGQVVGCVETGEADPRKWRREAALWDRTGHLWNLSRLVTVAGHRLEIAQEINNPGQILCFGAPTGRKVFPSSEYRAFMLTPRRP